MSAEAPRSGANLLRRFISRARSPLVANGYALVVSSGVTSALGLVYWALAARLYPESVVGLNSAALSALFFIVNLAQLNLAHTLTRFVAVAGRATVGLVVRSYLLSAGLTVVVTAGFLLGLGVWAPSLRELVGTPVAAFWFVLAAVVWGTFSLQDGVLVGLRQSRWVLYSSTAYAALKLVLLILLAARVPVAGILVSWMLPVLLVALPVMFLLFTRFIPRHVQATQEVAQPLTARILVRYVSGNYLSSMIFTSAITLMPVIVVEHLGAASGAYFYLSWTITYALYLVGSGMSRSLVAEGARSEENLDEHSYIMLIQTLQLVVPAVLVLFLGAPLVLQMFGSGYAAEGSALLRLLVLSAIPYSVIAAYTGVLRVRNEMAKLFVLYAVLSSAVVVGSFLTLDATGLSGVGWTWLISMSAVAAAVILAELAWSWLPFIHLPRALADSLHRLRIGLRAPRPGAVKALLTGVLSRHSTRTGDASSRNWEFGKAISTASDLFVLPVGPKGAEPTVLLKVPRSKAATEGLDRHTAVLRTLAAMPQLARFRSLLPVVASADWDEPAFIIESRMPGVMLSRFLRRRPVRPEAWKDALLDRAAAAIRELHEASAVPRHAGEADLEAWIGMPLAAAEGLKLSRSNQARVARLREELVSSLHGRPLRLGWIHGDYSPDNILMTADGAAVSAIIDWEDAEESRPVELDLVHLYVSSRMIREGAELGAILADELTRPNPSLADFLSRNGYGGELAPSTRELLLLTWLQQLEKNFRRIEGKAASRYWIAQNLERVLLCAWPSPTEGVNEPAVPAPAAAT